MIRLPLAPAPGLARARAASRSPAPALALALALAPALALALAGPGCGGSDKRTAGEPTPPAADDGAEPASAAGHRPPHHAELTPELDAFHEILAPRWHAEPGPARTKDTCAATPEFRTRAAAVRSASPPAGASAEAWAGAGAELEKAVSGLEAACGGADQAAFDGAFAAVHGAFHRAMELAAAGHGEAGGHGHHDHGQ